MSKIQSQKKCACGCALPVVSKANYRPGHDARHAGQVARRLIERPSDPAANQILAAMSVGLRAKVAGQIARATEKAEKGLPTPRKTVAAVPAPPQVSEAPEDVLAWVGRWCYEGRVEGTEFVYTNRLGDEVRTERFQLDADR